MKLKPLLIVIAGPNGAGKTTFIEKMNQEILSKTIFINADNIAKKLKEKYPERNESALNILAGKETIKLYEEYLSQKRSFSMETTLSGHSPIQTLKEAKEKGFETSLVYIGIESPVDSKMRIEKRVSLGGHNIPDEDIIRRHGRSMKNLKKAVTYVDRVKVYDNTTNRYQLLFELEGDLIKSFENIILPEWVVRLINPGSLKLGGKIEFIV